MKKNKTEYYPIIVSILHKDSDSKQIVILFDNSEVKVLELNEFILGFPKAETYNKKILNKKNIGNLKIEMGTLYYPDFDFAIDNFSIYDMSKTADFKPEYLQVIRKNKGITQKQLAEKIKIEPSELSKIETGKQNNLRVISKALNVLL